MTKKGKKHTSKQAEQQQASSSQQQQSSSSHQQQPSSSQQQQKQPHSSQSQPQKQPHGSQPQQQKQPHGSQSQQQKQPHSSQSQPQKQPHGSQPQQQKQPHGSQSQQQKQPHGSQSQQQKQPHSSQPQQQKQPHGSQQQQSKPAAWQQKQQQPVASQQEQQKQQATLQQPQQSKPAAWQQKQQQPVASQQEQQKQQATLQQPQQSKPAAWQQKQQQPVASQQEQQKQQATLQQPQQSKPAAWQQKQQQPVASQQEQQKQQATLQQPQQSKPAAWQQKQQQPVASQQEQQKQQATLQQPQQSKPAAWQQKQQQPVASQQEQEKQQAALQQPQQRQPAAVQQPQQCQPAAAQQLQQKQPAAVQQPQQCQPAAAQQLQQRQSAAIQQPQQRQSPSLQQPQQRQSPSLQQQQGESPALKQKQESTVSLVRKNGKSILPSTLHQSYLNQIPKRKTGGTQGRQIEVETNMLKLIFKPNFVTNIIHYDVVITPDKPKFLLRKIFEEFRKKHFPARYPAFDGNKNAYSGKELPFGDESVEDEIKILDPERRVERVFKIYLKKVAALDLTWLKNLNTGIMDGENEFCGIQALEIILRHGPACQFTTVGRSLFPPPEPGRVINLPDGLDLWIGVFQSVQVGRKAYLNIDVAHKGFPKDQSVIDLMKDLCRPPRSNAPLDTIQPQDIQRNKEKINKFLKGLKIQYELPGQPTTKRTYRVNELAECPRRNTFSLENNTKCTVETYFLQNKNYRIQFPELPCLWVGSRNSGIHLPAELCTIVAGQVTQRRLNEEQTAKLIRYAATDTRTRKEKIMRGFAKMKLNEQPTLMKEFHLSVQGEFEKIPARVLQAPVLQYNQKEVNVVKGVWRAEKFYKPCNLPDDAWTILNLDSRLPDRELYRLQSNLQDGGLSVNMTIGKPLTPFGNLKIQRNINNIIEYFQAKKNQQLQLVVVVIPVFTDAYSLVKQISELKVSGGIVTQCLKSQTLSKLSPSTVTNILLKINSKLNGVNHTLAPTYRPPCLKVPCMLIGADVTHPSPDATDIPSIAAVAASHDPNAFQYNIELRLQSPRTEMIQDLQQIIRSQLIYFFQKTGYKPKKIIFYRDGVGEGDLTKVMHYELSAIRKAIAQLERSTEHTIPITFLIVQKRHHVRLFPTDTRNCDQKNFNVLAGTIVDTEITHPTHIDFYLVSHASIQGTARPTKYRCICNENDMSEDEIEQLTYYLCHMFARCTRSVSYPAPTYYAHLAAFRARALIHNVPLNINNLQEEQRINMNLQMNAKSPMFFV